MPATQTCNQLAAQGKNIIRKANAQVPVLRFKDIPGMSGGGYNYRSDTP
jgi:hypothetical protein